MSEVTETSVIVVGGSLIGLSAALFLSHWDVPVILLERHLGSSLHPRAFGYTARTLELFRSVGVEDKLPKSRWIGGPPKRVIVETLAGKWHEASDWTASKGKGENGAGPGNKKPADFGDYSPVTGVAVAQDQIEPVLRSCARDLGADLRLGYKVIDCVEDDEGVSVTAVDKEGATSKYRAEYLVACDGAHSPIREGLEIKRSGVGHIRGLRSILFRCQRIEEYLNHGYSQFQVEGSDKSFEALMTTYGDGRWMLAWHDETEIPLSEATQKDWIRKAVGLDLADDEVDLITTGKWDLGGFIADSFSTKRIFLAGDAAHQLPPNRGGYGANTGFADAHNLSWKLASVLSGKSTPELLGTYDEERRPVAQTRHDQIFARPDYARFLSEKQDWPGKGCEVIDDIAMELGQLYRSKGFVGAGNDLPPAKVPDAWDGQPGSRAPHAHLKKGGKPISSLDLFGKTWVVLSGDESWRSCVAKVAEKTGIACVFVCIGQDVNEEGDEGSLSQLFGIGVRGASLIRPDGFIAWKAVDKDAQGSFMDDFQKVSFATNTA